MDPELEADVTDEGVADEGPSTSPWSSPRLAPPDNENSLQGSTVSAVSRPGRGSRSAGRCGPRTPEAVCETSEQTSPSEGLGESSDGNLVSHDSGDVSTHPRSDRAKKDGHMALHDDHGELDYDEDESAAGDGDDNPAELTKDPSVGNCDEGLHGNASLEQDVTQSPPTKESTKAKSDKVKDGEENSDGEIKDEDCEDGEIKDDDKKPFVRTQLCRFFKRSHCTWGFNCRFLHPGVNDKGAYSLVERPGLRAAFAKPVTAEAMELVNVPPAVPPYIATAPKPESAWERGLRQAKEAMRRACKKKETETDLEVKKLSMTLADAENKENDKKYKDPYYDDVDDVDITLPVEQPRKAVDYGAEQGKKSQWRSGNYENFEIRSSRDSHSNRSDAPAKDSAKDSAPPARYALPKPPAQYDIRSSESRLSPPHAPRRERLGSPAAAGPTHDGLRSGDTRGRDSSGAQPAFSSRADDWHDPWQRSRESRTRRRSATPVRRRQGSRGSASSGSSASSYSRSRSGSYSSSLSDSRSSSATSASSRSSTKSRSRGPSLRRGPPASDRGAPPSVAAQPPRKPPLLQDPPQALLQQTTAGRGRAIDRRPPPEHRRGREDWQGPGRGMPAPISGSQQALPGTRDGRNVPRRPESPSRVQPKYQPYLTSSTPNPRAPSRLPAADGIARDRSDIPSAPSGRSGLPNQIRGPARRSRSGSSGSESSRSVSPPSLSHRRRNLPSTAGGSAGSDPFRQRQDSGTTVPKGYGSSHADGFSMSPTRDRSPLSMSPTSPQRADRGRRRRSRSPSGDDVYGDLDRMPFNATATNSVIAGSRDARNTALLSRTNSTSREPTAARKPDEPSAPVQRQKVGPQPPATGAASSQQMNFKARPIGEAPRVAAEAPAPAGNRVVQKAGVGSAQSEQQQPAVGTTVRTAVVPPGAPVQKQAIKLTLISKPQPINVAAKKRNIMNEGSLSPPAVTVPPPAKRPALSFAPDSSANDKTDSSLTITRSAKASGMPSAAATQPPRLTGNTTSVPGGTGTVIQPPTATAASAVSATVTSVSASKAAAAKKTTSSRREELLKQLKAVEDAIARKRSKV